MKKDEKRLLFFMIAFIIAIISFSTIMVLMFIYPQISFWSLMAFFVIIIGIVIAPTLKDTIILVVGMIIGAIVGTFVDKFVSHYFENLTLIGFIVQSVFLAPVYLPLSRHFVNMCRKRVRLMRQQELIHK